jgi:formylglycine-generating enzyme required for sulfatase activity
MTASKCLDLLGEIMQAPCLRSLVILFPMLYATWVIADQTPPAAIAPFDADQAADFQQRWADHLNQERVLSNSIGMKMVLLPPGEFTMGRTEEELDKILAIIEGDPELKGMRGGTLAWSMLMMPARRVRITKPFYMGACEVTVEQFRRFTEASGYKTEAEQGLNHGRPYQGRRPLSTWRKPMAWRPNYRQDEDEPVLQLCWNDCVAFCRWLSEKEGQEYCLPTEAEWEYACRAGTTTPWSFGDFDDFDRVAHEYAWWSDGGQGKHDRPRPVGLGKPNAFGLYDMHGNVWEYVADWWHRLSYKEAPLNDPTGPEIQSEKNDLRRIIRGSSFDWGRWGGNSAYRMRITQRSNQHPHMGFRVAMRISGATGIPPAVDPDTERRGEKRDPGENSKQVTAALQAGAEKAEYAEELVVDLGGGVSMEFVLIPAGSFLMGSQQGPKDERPLHRVVISKPFYMARHEVTQSQWEGVMGPNRWLAGLRQGDNDMSGPTKAMNGLSWNACRDFIGKLRAIAPGREFSLPTEAQWEYACRAGSRTEFHFGNDDAMLGEYAWFAGNMIWPGQPGFRDRTFYHDVGQKKPNAWGLYDMHGGVWEWCADWYDEDYYFDSPLKDPVGPESGRLRVLRGGSWFRYAKYARSAYRRPFHPECDGDAVTAWILDFGCRLVINLP